MHPEEKVFASSGAGGKVVLREARVQGDEGFEQMEGGWGEEKRVLDTGKDKFGMDLKYVSKRSPNFLQRRWIKGGS